MAAGAFERARRVLGQDAGNEHDDKHCADVPALVSPYRPRSVHRRREDILKFLEEGTRSTGSPRNAATRSKL